MTSDPHGGNDLDEVVNVNAIKVRGENTSLPHPCFYWEPVAKSVSPANSALEIWISLYDDIEKYERNLSMQQLDEEANMNKAIKCLRGVKERAIDVASVAGIVVDRFLKTAKS